MISVPPCRIQMRSLVPFAHRLSCSWSEGRKDKIRRYNWPLKSSWSKVRFQFSVSLCFKTKWNSSEILRLPWVFGCHKVWSWSVSRTAILQKLSLFCGAWKVLLAPIRTRSNVHWLGRLPCLCPPPNRTTHAHVAPSPDLSGMHKQRAKTLQTRVPDHALEE